jgi:hypothetical protein
MSRPLLSFPPASGLDTCVLLVVPIDLVPIVGGLFGQLEARSRWATPADWQQGYRAFTALEKQLMDQCLKQLVDSQDRVYRLLDAAMYGTVYSADVNEVTGETVVTPAIPDAPASSPILPGLVERMTNIERVLDNALNGTIYEPSYTNTAHLRLLLQGIIDRLITGDPEGDALLEQIRTLLL